jgi:hypothetical protein
LTNTSHSFCPLVLAALLYPNPTFSLILQRGHFILPYTKTFHRTRPLTITFHSLTPLVLAAVL